MWTESWLWLFAFGIQLIGISSVIATRISENSSAQAAFQVLFFVCFAIVGGATVWTFMVDELSAVSCAATLPIMAVGVTLDLGQRSPVSAI